LCFVKSCDDSHINQQEEDMSQNLPHRDFKIKAPNGCTTPKVLLSLLAGSVGMALSVPAPALELSVYGVGHLSADSIDTDDDSSGYIHSNSSRLGIKGSHGVGNGAAILFQYESGVDLTGKGTGDGNGGANSSGQLFTRARDSYVGVKSGFGTVLFGRLGGLNQWLYDYNLFADQVGDLGNIWGGDGLPGRTDHAAWYRTPSFGGATLALTYVPDQGTNDANAYIGKVEYGNAESSLAAPLRISAMAAAQRIPRSRPLRRATMPVRSVWAAAGNARPVSGAYRMRTATSTRWVPQSS
jgi:predicted porin